MLEYFIFIVGTAHKFHFMIIFSLHVALRLLVSFYVDISIFAININVFYGRCLATDTGGQTKIWF